MQGFYNSILEFALIDIRRENEVEKNFAGASGYGENVHAKRLWSFRNATLFTFVFGVEEFIGHPSYVRCFLYLTIANKTVANGQGCMS